MWRESGPSALEKTCQLHRCQHQLKKKRDIADERAGKAGKN